MIPVVNFVYPLFINDDLLKKAGVSARPSTRTEFKAAAKKITALGDNDAGLGPPALHREPERDPERPHVVGLGLGRQHAEGRQARPHQRRGHQRGRLRQGPLRRRA